MDVANIGLSVIIPAVIFLIVLFFFLGWYLNSKVGKRSLSAAEERSKQIINDAQKESQNLKREKLIEVKDEWYKKKLDFDNDLNQKKQKYSNIEKQLSAREENIEKKFDLVLKKEKENEKLEKISGLSKEEAKKMLMENLVDNAKAESARLIKDLHDKAKTDAKKDAQKIIVQAIQKTAADYAVETTVSVVQIQNDQMKGRIIGKEGRNIRSFEAATGVDVIVDDTPEAVILSSFDQFRREVARVSLERLITDGRIHPARIEEVVEKVRQELEEEMIKEGENTILQLGLHNMHP